MTHPVLEHLGRFRVRWAVAAGVAVAALGLTAFAVGGRTAADTHAVAGPSLNIAVVPPVERDIQPGDIMDVGQLNDGFDGRMPERVQQASADMDFYLEQPAYIENDQARRAEKRPSDDQGSEDRSSYNRAGYDQLNYDYPAYARPVSENVGYDRPEDRYDPRAGQPRDRGQREAFQGRPMSFGFDRPQPDWRAERDARRAAFEARERERDAQWERRYASNPRQSDNDFY